jgi:N-methylhydantoinase B
MRRYKALCDKYGSETIRACMNWIFDRSDQVIRSKIAGWPEGTYEAECYVDHDGIELDKPQRIKLSLNVQEGAIRVNFDGSSPTARGPINCPFVLAEASVAISLLGITVPHDQINAGHLRAFEVTAPPHTIVNPQWPAPCDSFAYVSRRVRELVYRALAASVPGVVPAGSHQLNGVYLYRMDSQLGTPFIYSEPFSGGFGARPEHDGASALMMGGDVRNAPIEVLETRYPFLVERHALDTGNMGIGKHRGGFGVIHDYRLTTDNVTLSVMNDSKVSPPWGLFGGKEAQTARVVAWPGTPQEKVFTERGNLIGPFQSGDRVSAHSSGGGGWGDPLERDPQLVERDVQLEYVTVQEAADAYGVVIAPDGKLDRAATAALRASRRPPPEAAAIAPSP